MNDPITILHALSADDGTFLAEVEVEDSTGVCEIITPDDSSFCICFSRREIRNEVAAYLGLDDEEVYLTDEDESRILY